MINEDFVFLEVAKLLREKGFYQDFLSEITPVWKLNGNRTELVFHGYDNYPCENDEWYSAPTLQMAMKWLREEKHYYIQIMLDSWACGDRCGFYVVIQKMDSDFEMMLANVVEKVFYETYEEAANAALLYILKELI